MTHAAESTHWYTRAGEPAYTVKAKAGHDRPTTLRDARTMGLVPSVTTIIKCADRPGLTNWMIDQGILAALTLPRIEGEPEAEWLKRVKQDSKETARKAAERGTAIHAAIQGSYEGKHPGEEFLPHSLAADQAIVDWLQMPSGMLVEAERSFSSSHGFGGKVDLVIENTPAVIDFKTKEFGPEDDLKTWDEHAMQLAAYREGLGMPKARCAICYVSVNNPGLAKLIEIPEEELERGFMCFVSLLSFWQAKNKYISGWDEKKAA